MAQQLHCLSHEDLAVATSFNVTLEAKWANANRNIAENAAA